MSRAIPLLPLWAFVACSRVNENVCVCNTYGERRDVYRNLAGKPEGKRLLGRRRRRREDNTKTDLQQVGCGAMDWIDLA